MGSETKAIHPNPFRPVILMGVSGSGKTTVGLALSEHLGCHFFDADDFHPAENIAKMSAGTPLTDADRLPWLQQLNQLIAQNLSTGEPFVLACSALKKSYRVELLRGNLGVIFVYLQADYDSIWSRMQAREGHYMKAEMLQSQFFDLEEPAPVEAITIPMKGDIQDALGRISAVLGLDL